MESAPRLAGWFVHQIQHLYQVESALRAHRAGPKLRAAVRSHQSQPIVKRLHRALGKLKAGGRQLPQSPLAGAMEYVLGQWSTLTVYLEDGKRHP